MIRRLAFSSRGNIKIGPKGAAPLVVAGDLADTYKGIPVDANTRVAQFFHLNQPDPNSGTTDLLFGSLHWINDPIQAPLAGSHDTDDPTNPPSVVAGRIFVDPINQRIFDPAEGAVPVYNQKGIVRNSNILFPFMDRDGTARPVQGWRHHRRV